jgi:hypothetical protein
MCNAGPDDARLLPKSLAGTAQLPADFCEAGAADVAQLDVLQMPPDSFLRVEFGRVAGEAFEVQPVAGFHMQELLDGAATMDRRAVPEHEQLAWYMTQQVAAKANDFHLRDGVLMNLKVQPLILTHGTDDGQMVTRQALVQYRRVGHGRVRPYDGRQQVKAALIDEHHLAALLLCLIF